MNEWWVNTGLVHQGHDKCIYYECFTTTNSNNVVYPFKVLNVLERHFYIDPEIKMKYVYLKGWAINQEREPYISVLWLPLS